MGSRITMSQLAVFLTMNSEHSDDLVDWDGILNTSWYWGEVVEGVTKRDSSNKMSLGSHDNGLKLHIAAK